MSLSYDAMMFAYEKHKNQVRKYTNEPYFVHLAEVVGIVSTVSGQVRESVTTEEVQATAWLHDCVEDQGVTFEELKNTFGVVVMTGVKLLSDLEEGNRKIRKQLSCERLGHAPMWVQTIKCADLISNTKSIVQHDPKFAEVYLQEKRNLLTVLTRADRRLFDLASSLV